MNDKNKEFFYELKKVIITQTKKAQKLILINRGFGSKEPQYMHDGTYNPFFLEPIMVAREFGMTLNVFEKFIMETEEFDILDTWNNFKKFGIVCKIYDVNFANIRPQLAEFSLKWFDKNATTMSDVIIKQHDDETEKLLTQIEDLKNEIKYLKGERGLKNAKQNSN